MVRKEYVYYGNYIAQISVEVSVICQPSFKDALNIIRDK